jgi:RNA polymerase sigma factor (sigma-70 family)
MAGVAARDGQAVAGLVDRFQRRVYGLAITMLGDVSAAEDVSQDVFLRVWRHAAAYDPARASVTSWLLTITRNRCIDVLRTRHDVPRDPEKLCALVEAGCEEGDVNDERVVERQRLRRALQELSSDQRRAVLLACFAGDSAAEIAEREGIPLGTAKSRIRAALAKLRASLDGDRTQ